MKNAGSTELKTLIDDIVRRSTVAHHLKSIVLESDEASDENGFFRVTIALDGLDGIDDEDMVALTASIEHAVDDPDARFPSMRFSESRLMVGYDDELLEESG